LNSSGGKNKRISHVSMYVGNGLIIHSVSKGVKLDSLNNKYYMNNLKVIKRICLTRKNHLISQLDGFTKIYIKQSNQFDN